MNNPIKIDLSKCDSKALQACLGSELSDALQLWLTSHDNITDEELTQLYFSFCPDAQGLKQSIALADVLYKKQDYRVAFHLYMNALDSNPLSTLLLKKAYNCTYLGAFNKGLGLQLLSKLNRLNAIISASGTGDSPESPVKVAQTTDAYQFLFNVIHAKDVASHKEIDRQGEYSIDELLITVNGEKEARLFHVACPFETDDDRNEFLIKKKGF